MTLKEKAKNLFFKLCKNYLIGQTCPLGAKCSFAHGEHELNAKQHVPANYKTVKCKHFHEEMFCQYGPRCQFLHSSNRCYGNSSSYAHSYTQKMRNMEKFFSSQAEALQNFEEFFFKRQYSSAHLKRLAVFDSLASP